MRARWLGKFIFKNLLFLCLLSQIRTSSFVRLPIPLSEMFCKMSSYPRVKENRILWTPLEVLPRIFCIVLPGVLLLGHGEYNYTCYCMGVKLGLWPLTFWCRNYFFNFSTPCIKNVNSTGTKCVRIMKQTAF